MLITEFLRALESVVPLTAVGYAGDAVGLQVGLPADTPLTNVLLAYETTAEVIQEARERGANLIVAFHPLIFPTIGAITDTTRTGLLVRDLVKSDIALYIQHTAFDTHPDFGTSRLMADALGLRSVQTLSPLTGVNPSGAVTSTGMGAIGELPETLSREKFLTLVSSAFCTPVVRHNAGGSAMPRRIAVLGGAGMDYYVAARASGADAFITGDVRYHDFYRADHDGILLVDAGHAETERFVTVGMLRAARKAIEALNLHSELPESCLLKARNEPNGVRYHSNS